MNIDTNHVNFLKWLIQENVKNYHLDEDFLINIPLHCHEGNVSHEGGCQGCDNCIYSFEELVESYKMDSGPAADSFEYDEDIFECAGIICSYN